MGNQHLSPLFLLSRYVLTPYCPPKKNPKSAGKFRSECSKFVKYFVPICQDRWLENIPMECQIIFCLN